MTSQPATQPTTPPEAAEPRLGDVVTGDAAFDAYAAAVADSHTPLLGHIVWYSVYDSEVTPADLEGWFTELGLDPAFVPPPLRAVDAFEKVTGPEGVRVSYPLDDPTATGPGRRRRQDGKGRSASLMVRPVRRDGGQIIRHVVREVRDETSTSLSYDTRLGVCIFHRDNSAGSDDGAGSLQVEPDHAAIAQLPAAEQTTVRAMLDDIATSYQRRCTYLTGDKLRSVIRRYVEHLNAIRVRPTGGVYFVHHQHADVLAGLRALARRFGDGSHLVRIPIPDQDEMREMVISAFTTKAKDDLDKLARDIATAQRGGRWNDAQKLYARFSELQKATAEHAEILSTSLDDTTAALDLVKLQLGSFLANTEAGDEDDDSQNDTGVEEPQ